MQLIFLTVAIGLIATTLAQDRIPSLTQLLSSQQNLSDFSTLLTSYGDVYANLFSQQNITIFAPSNEALTKLPYQVLGPAFATNNSDAILQFLQYHVLPNVYPSDFFNGTFKFLPTFLRDQRYENVTGGQVIAGVQQAGEVWVAVSGLGSRATLSNIVSYSQNTTPEYSPIDLLGIGSPLPKRCPPHYRHFLHPSSPFYCFRPTIQSLVLPRRCTLR